MVLKLFIQNNDDEDFDIRYFQFKKEDAWDYTIRFNATNNPNEVILQIVNTNYILTRQLEVIKQYELIRSFSPASVKKVQLYNHGYLCFDTDMLGMTYEFCSAQLNELNETDDRDNFNFIIGFTNSKILTEEERNTIGIQIIEEDINPGPYEENA